MGFAHVFWMCCTTLVCKDCFIGPNTDTSNSCSVRVQCEQEILKILSSSLQQIEALLVKRGSYTRNQRELKLAAALEF